MNALCTMCGAERAVLDFPDGQSLGPVCARGIVTGGMAAMRMSGIVMARPQVGGPTFNRGPDPEPEVQPKPATVGNLAKEALARGVAEALIRAET